MKTLTLNAWGKDHPISFTLNKYADNGNLYVGMLTHEDGFPEPWSDLTVNLGIECLEGFAFIDTNNNPGIIGWLEANNLGKRTYNLVPSGFCMYEEFYFNMPELLKYTEDEDALYEDLHLEQLEQM